MQNNNVKNDDPKTHMCYNGCEFAKQVMLLSCSGHQGDVPDPGYLYRCMKLDQLVTIDTILHKVGCASYSYVNKTSIVQEAEDLIKAVDEKIEEIKKDMPILSLPEQNPVEQVINEQPLAVQSVEPEKKDTTEPIVSTVVEKETDVPVNRVVIEEKNAQEPVQDDLKKKRTRRTKAEIEAANKAESEKPKEPKDPPSNEPTMIITVGPGMVVTSENPVVDQK